MSEDNFRANEVFEVRDEDIAIERFIEICHKESTKIKLSAEVCRKVHESRALLDRFVEQERVIYGVNTSMGGFAHVLVSIDLASQLQNNLLHSVATNVGEYFDDQSVRAIMLARIFSLARGVSAISLDNLQIYVELFNHRIYPCIPQKGSLGASGDLGPLAFIALAATGQWRVRRHGIEQDAKDVLEVLKIRPMRLSYKEGLAMINGTSAMAGIAALNWHQADVLLRMYTMISCLSFEALETKQKPFDPRVHQRKRHVGQLDLARRISTICASSRQIVDEHEEEKRIQALSEGKTGVQSTHRQIEDAYSLRCTPQILGPVQDSLCFIKTMLENELNSSSDNPLVIPEENEVFHNGHFHGQYMAMAMDHLSIALTTLSNLSDRRIDRYMDKNNSNGLPPFLCKDGQGLRLGLMGGQFMATSLTAENRSLCVPLSIQTLTSTGDFQDIVSFGLIAARRAREILNNTAYIVAFELLCACQAVDIREAQDKLSVLTRQLYLETRKVLPFLAIDLTITPFLEKLKLLVHDTDVCAHLDLIYQSLPIVSKGVSALDTVAEAL